MYIEAILVNMTRSERRTAKRTILVRELELRWHGRKVLAVCIYPLAFRLNGFDVGDTLALWLTARTEEYRSELSGELEYFTENYVVDLSSRQVATRSM